MIYGKNVFKIVIIDYPIYALDNPDCAILLGKALKMKYAGYSLTYNESILPMDKTDFFGTHIMLCEESEEGLNPIFAYKSVSLDRCQKYNVEFPIISTLKSDGHHSCLDALETIFKEVNNSALISYDSSWAQNLNYRFSSDPEIKGVLREIMSMAIINHHIEFNLPHMITCGAVKVKTDRFFLNIGLKKLNENAHFHQKALNNEESVVFYNNVFSLDAYRIAKKYKNLWDNKLVINGAEKKQSALLAA